MSSANHGRTVGAFRCVESVAVAAVADFAEASTDGACRRAFDLILSFAGGSETSVFFSAFQLLPAFEEPALDGAKPVSGDALFIIVTVTPLAAALNRLFASRTSDVETDAEEGEADDRADDAVELRDISVSLLTKLAVPCSVTWHLPGEGFLRLE